MNPLPPTSQFDPASGNLARRLLSGELGALAALLVVVVFFGVADIVNRGEGLSAGFGEGFTSVRNLRVVLSQTSMVAVAALGMTLIIISGGIDLSAGTALTLCTVVMAWCLREEYGATAAVVAAVGCGVLCGLLNGLLISLLRVVPFIVTLGTLTIYLGLGKLIASESTVFPSRDAIPDWLIHLSSTRPPNTWYGFIPRIAPGVWIAFVLAILVGLLLHYTVFGRHIFALGSSEATARLCGIPIRRTKTAVYATAGLFVGIAGMYNFSKLKIGNPNEGQGLELDIIAAVVIGGGSLAGGRGSVVGTLTGAAIMAVIRSGCDQLGVRNATQNITIGAIIILAVTLDQFRQRRLTA